MQDMGGKATPLQNVKTNQKGLQMPPGVQREEDVNEVFLFHGLNASLFADSICRNGMDTKHCNLEGMFGSGLYFAEHASKSNQYCHSGACTNVGAAPRDSLKRAKFDKACKCKKQDECCMLLETKTDTTSIDTLTLMRSSRAPSRGAKASEPRAWPQLAIYSELANCPRCRRPSLCPNR